jgi:hypothetical protein
MRRTLLEFVFDDYAQNIQQNQRKNVNFSVISRFFPGILGLDTAEGSKNSTLKAQTLHRQLLAPWVESHQEPARGRHHRDPEPSARVSLGTPVRLGEIIECPVHMKGPVTHSQQDCRTLRMSLAFHGE